METSSTYPCGTESALLDALPRLRAQYGEACVRRQLDALQQHGSAIEDSLLWLRTALEHDFKFTPIQRLEACPCGSRDHVLLCRFVFWNLLGLRRCQRCGLVFLSPRLTQEAMYQLFNQHYFDYSDPEFWGRRRIPVFRDIMRLVRRFECQHVFDVGAAFGHFVAWARKEGFHGTGCDLSQSAVAWGQANLGVTLYHGYVHELDLSAGCVDCVVSLDTFYYTSDPLRDLRAIRRLLTPRGHVILRLRNGLWTLARARREGRKPVGRDVMPSEHLWSFTPSTIAHLMTMCGFEIRLCEPAAYSRTRLARVHAAWVSANRLLVGVGGQGAILTRSFNIVGRRTD